MKDPYVAALADNRGVIVGEHYYGASPFLARQAALRQQLPPGFMLGYPLKNPDSAGLVSKEFGVPARGLVSVENDRRNKHPFQDRVEPWMMACFGAEIAGDKEERNHRFLEEALELVQACGGKAQEAHQLVDYVFNRPVGEPAQEVGGVMVTLAALCLAQGMDMHEAGETELARVWTKVAQIRAKQAAKPKFSPLPQEVPDSDESLTDRLKKQLKFMWQTRRINAEAYEVLTSMLAQP